MSKGQIFIVGTSALILISFGALCYLMTTVNPKPLKSSPDDARRYNTVDTFYVNDFFLPSDNLDYGLEKVPEGYGEIINITQYPINRIIPYAYDPSQSITKRVLPLLFPRMNYTQIINNCSRSANETASYFPIKGHRRSIKDQKKPRNHIQSPNSVIVKIVDDDGIQKIEIKMRSKLMNSQKARKYRSSSSKSKSKFSRRNKTNLFNLNTDDNVVILDVNDTIVLNIVGDSVILSGANNIETVNIDDELKIDKSKTDPYFNNSMDDNEKNSDETKRVNTRMFDLLKTSKEKSINQEHFTVDKNLNETEILSLNTKNLTKSIFNYEVDDKKSKADRRGVKDVKNNNSVIDLLILEDSLRGALINENDPFVLKDRTLNSTV